MSAAMGLPAVAQAGLLRSVAALTHLSNIFGIPAEK
jgi:hypothetical protein